jgi:hypothetical protein
MQSLAPPADRNPAGHTAAEILAALRGVSGARRFTFRYELLNSANTKIADLDNVVACRLSQNWLADIKRKATFTVRDTGFIDFLSDRIKPFVRMHMPPWGPDDWVEWPQGVFLLASPSRSVDESGVVIREVEAYDQLQVFADDLVSARYTVTPSVTQTEDFEDATFTWGWTGTWTRQAGTTHAGTYAYKAATVGHNQTSTAILTLPAGATTMRVWVKVSSEEDYDFFRIRSPGGAVLYENSGNVNWVQVTVNVTGMASVFFEYDKDVSVTELSDTAWIDDIEIDVSSIRYTDVVSTLLGSVPKNIVPHAALVTTAREWEPGTSKLSIINQLLSAINYESLSFDEDGAALARPYTVPSSRPEEYVYADNAVSVMTPDVTQTLDLFSIPNRWTMVVSDPDRPALSSTYTNNNPASPTSVPRRQRTIVDFRTEQDAADQASLDARVARLAFEASQVYEAIEFETGLIPIHSGNDVYRITFSRLAIDAKYSEHTWEMDLAAAATMKHRARRVVTI